MAKQNRSSMSIEEVVKSYYDTKEKYDSLTKKFNNIKKDFYSKMDELMDDEDELTVEFFTESYKVKKVQKKQVTFDIGKLERSLDKQTLKKVIIKRCSVVDYNSLINYLKELGADPKIVKELIVTTKEVDADEVDKLSELGEINEKVVANAAKVSIASQYYTVKKV